jgi:hypothetical protein
MYHKENLIIHILSTRRAAIAKELTKLKQEEEMFQKGHSSPNWKNGSPVR